MFGRRVRVDHLYEESRLKSIQSQLETYKAGFEAISLVTTQKMDY